MDENDFAHDKLVVYKLGRIEALLDELKGTTNKRIEDHEARIGKLENLKYWVLGAAAVIGTLVSFAKDWLLNG